MRSPPKKSMLRRSASRLVYLQFSGHWRLVLAPSMIFLVEQSYNETRSSTSR